MNHRPRLTILSVALLVLVSFAFSDRWPQLTSASSASQETETSVNASANGAGNQLFNFADVKELTTSQSPGQQPTTLVSADFDSDGVADLVTADVNGGLNIYRGNSKYLHSPMPPTQADQPDAQPAAAIDTEPFHNTGNTAVVSTLTNFLFSGDFNADGHQDIVAAARSGNSLHFLAGDGAGHFAPEIKIPLGGTITSAAADEIGRPDGQTDLAISVTTKRGSQLLVFEHPEGAFKHKPQIFPLPAPASDIALGSLDQDSFRDVALAVDESVVVVHGRGQAYPWDMMAESGIKRPAAYTQTRRLGFRISSLVAGKFGPQHGDGLAIQSEDGSLHVLEMSETRPVAIAGESSLPTSSSATTSRPNSEEGQVQSAATKFLPAGIDARSLLLIEQKPTPNHTEQKLGLTSSNRSLNGQAWQEEFFTERAEKIAKSGAELSKLPANERAKVRAAEKQQAKAKRELAKAEFMRMLAPRPAQLASFSLRILDGDARLSRGQGFSRPSLVKARVSNSSTDDLILIDSTNHQLQVVTTSPASGKHHSVLNSQQSEKVALDAGSAPIAVLAMRLNSDARNDLVILRAGSPHPALVQSQAANTFVVTTTADVGEGSLRQAISDANTTAGADLITFNIGSGAQTIAPASPLPDIREAVTIDGTTQPGFNGAPLIEIKGVNVPAGKDGLRINASNCVVRGLVVNEFVSALHENGFSQVGGNGITIFNFAGQSFAGNNIIEGNYLGTDITGTQDKGNAVGLLIFDSDGNTVGGTTPAARNVMSGNGRGELNVALEESGNKPGVGLAITVGNNTLIKGNYIGTNAAGTSRINNSDGVFLSGKNNLVGGDEAGAGNTISGNGDTRPIPPNSPDYCIGGGVSVEVLTNTQTGEFLTYDNVFKGNKIGTTPDGTAPLGNCSEGIVFPALTNTVVGSITEGGRNTVSGNTYYGIHCRSSFGYPGGEANFGQCTIAGNNVGTDPTGTQAIPNNFDNPVYTEQIGIFHSAGAIWLDLFGQDLAVVGAPGGTTPGGPCTGFCNLVSGNDAFTGISRIGEGSALVANNYVGTNRAGTAALPNRSGGLLNYFGDTSVGAVFTDDGGNQIRGGNMISGNDGAGVFGTFYGSAIVGNLVGTSADGLSAIPNAGEGLIVDSLFSQGAIGGTSLLQRNVIAGNTGHGMTLSNAFGFAVLNNHIGVNREGGPLGNGGSGVHVRGFPACPEDDPPLPTQIGGRGANEGNVIKNNGGAGLLLTLDSTGTRNCQFGTAPDTNKDVPIVGNSIANNGGLGIDLTTTAGGYIEADGVTENDCFDRDEGANRKQNFPELFAPTFNANGTVTVTGFLRSTPARDFTIDFYVSQAADPTTYGEGETHLGSQGVRTNGNGFIEITFTSTATVAAESVITATATDAGGNTSEFSCAAGVCTQPEPGGSVKEKLARLEAATCSLPIYVNITSDEPDADTADGVCDINTSNTGEQCSLRAAIEESNARPGFDYIGFQIPGGGGVQTITPATQLPPLIEEFYLDGTAQTGYAPGAPVIELRGDQLGTTGIGLLIHTSDSTINGLVVNRFAFAQITIGSESPDIFAQRNAIESCFLGINPDGMTRPNPVTESYGVVIGGNANSNTIGGASAANGNVIAGCKTANVLILNQNSQSNKVFNNKIGTNKDGTAEIGSAVGVELADGTSGNVIGGLLGDTGNLISGFISISIKGAHNNRVSGNLIGTNAAGDATLSVPVFSNETGISLSDGAQNNIIGGSTASRNVIGGFRFAGVRISTGASGTRISGNYIGTSKHGTSALPNQHEGIFVEAGIGSGTVIGGNTAAPNVISGNETGISLGAGGAAGDSVSGVTISHNRIGTNPDGTAKLPTSGQKFGIVLAANVQATNISENTISGNELVGVFFNSGPTGNTIYRNRIGTNNSGTAAIPNHFGVLVVRTSANSVIENLVSGNKVGISLGEGLAPVEGITISGDGFAYAENNIVQGNRIGTNAAGNAAIPNEELGLIVGANARNNQIGGSSTAGQGNVISGHAPGETNTGLFIGVFEEGAATETASGNVIQGNRIGAWATEDRCLPNTIGIGLANTRDNLIGATEESSAEDYGNRIVCNRHGVASVAGNNENNILGFNRIGDLDLNNLGNSENGIQLVGSGDQGNQIIGNKIGNNGGDGVHISNGASDNTIGGTAENSGNTITGNDGAGVRITETGGTGNVIDPNVIHANAGLGIDLDLMGTTSNDPGDADVGPNNVQNYPEFTSATIVGGDLILKFKVDSAPGNSDYGTDGLYIEFFEADAGLEGQTFLGSTHYTETNYGNGSPGSVTFNAGNAATLEIALGDRIVATATDADGNTSEFTGTNVGTVSGPTAATAVIEGQIVDANGAPVHAVVINLSGTQNRRTITDGNGRYHFTEVETTGFYTVAPTRVNYTFTPANRAFSSLGHRTEAVFTAAPNTVSALNAIDTPEYFVRQHYLDFLGREPDESGFNFWSDQIIECGDDAGCVERRRMNVSAAYFLSIEFQATGGFVDGLYRASFGTRPNFAGFMRDIHNVARDVVVGRPGWETKLDANKESLLQRFIDRPEFISAFSGLTNEAFVNTLISHTGVNFDQSERAALVSGLAAGTQTRAAVLRHIAEDKRFTAAKFNDAFVMMQYFGYLRRDPDETGFEFWLNKLNQFGGDFAKAEMVKAFLESGEYRARFQN